MSVTLLSGDRATEILEGRTVDMVEATREPEPDNAPFVALMRRVWPTMSDEHKWFFVRMLLGDVSLEEFEQHMDEFWPKSA